VRTESGAGYPARAEEKEPCGASPQCARGHPRVGGEAQIRHGTRRPAAFAGCGADRVDDEPEIGALLAEILQKLGYRFDVKVSGEAAQLALMQRDYDMVLCDLRLPGLHGLDVRAPAASVSAHRIRSRSNVTPRHGYSA
jgi:hypothetical protein